MSLFDLTTDNNGDITGYGMSEKNIANFLTRDMGFLETEKRNTQILATMAAPQTVLASYNTEVNDLLGKAAIVFKADYNKLISLGATDRLAHEVSKDKATLFMTNELYILHIKYPLMNDINTLASAKAKTGVKIPPEKKL